MKKEKGIVILSDTLDDLMYDIEKQMKDGRVNSIKMTYSKSDRTWSNPGKLAASLYNDGNRFIITFGDEHQVTLSYGQAAELMAVLKIENSEETKFKYFKESK